MFKLFLAWFHFVHRDSVTYNLDSHQHNYLFTKNNLMDFITNHYGYFLKKFNRNLSSSDFDLYQIVSKFYEKDIDNVLMDSWSKNDEKRYLIFSRPGRIDVDLTQKLAESIINKLLTRKLITLSENKTFLETYKYTNQLY